MSWKFQHVNVCITVVGGESLCKSPGTSGITNRQTYVSPGSLEICVNQPKPVSADQYFTIKGIYLKHKKSCLINIISCNWAWYHISNVWLWIVRATLLESVTTPVGRNTNKLVDRESTQQTPVLKSEFGSTDAKKNSTRESVISHSFEWLCKTFRIKRESIC